MSNSVKPSGRRTRRNTLGAACALGLASSTGCAPTVDVLGVYFPAWLVSAVVGLVAAYILVRLLGTYPKSKTDVPLSPTARTLGHDPEDTATVTV